MPAEFDRWWNDLKKHKKRLRHWLPAARRLHTATARPLRYFTLCARSAIDVFMLARLGILQYDDAVGAISYVRFCESNRDQYPEILELIGIEDAGFFGSLEDLVLFQDGPGTGAFGTEDAIAEALEDEGLSPDLRQQLQAKRTHLQIAQSFPYDFVNLDFCGYYYPQPPNVLRINETVERILRWQAAAVGPTVANPANPMALSQFVLSVTCRYDADFPEEARIRLRDLVSRNRDEHVRYREVLATSRSVVSADEWAADDELDFFLSAWPKEIARLATEHCWDMNIDAYVHYDRVGESGSDYKIVCLVASFRRENAGGSYLDTALQALARDAREVITEIDRSSTEGQGLLDDLKDIVEFRNGQAERKGRPLLPAP